MTCKSVRDSVSTESPTRNRNENIERLALVEHSENPPISRGVRVDRMASGQTLRRFTVQTARVANPYVGVVGI